jgi:hypothetical protein
LVLCRIEGRAEEGDNHVETQTCVSQIVSPDEKPAMTLAVRMVAWLVAKARMIQPAVKETLQNMRALRRPHRFISRPLRMIPKALAIAWTLAAIKDQ